MRAISLWQPWASAVVLGIKGVETRHWPTDYRGPLAIHAALRWTKEQQHFAEVERALGRCPARLPFGGVIGVVRLHDCKPVEDLVPWLDPIEKLYGNYAAGRYGWILKGPRQFAEPIPMAGRQRFFNVPDELIPPA